VSVAPRITAAMTVDPRIEAWVSLQLSGVAPRPLAKMLRAFGTPEAVLAATPAQRRAAVTSAGGGALVSTPEPERVARTLAWLAQPDASLVAWDDTDYPRALLEIGDAPPAFYCLGRRELLNRPALAIVGSRNATPQGCADAEAFAAALAASGITIVSGLALGIDAAAHRGALAHPASSVAVVGTGLDRVYPARNRDLAHMLAARGVLVSEFAPGTPPLPANFPRRNRLISGLARGVLVVEATMSSGSLITARFAGEQGRDVFALPGSIHSPFSKGCHRLIREGAKLVETAQDILDELEFPAIAPTTAAPIGSPSGLEPAAAGVLAALGHAPVDVDTVVARCGESAATVLAALTTLELDGMVAPLPGGLWQRMA
jgi:DNA processing protein